MSCCRWSKADNDHAMSLAEHGHGRIDRHVQVILAAYIGTVAECPRASLPRHLASTELRTLLDKTKVDREIRLRVFGRDELICCCPNSLIIFD